MLAMRPHNGAEAWPQGHLPIRLEAKSAAANAERLHRRWLDAVAALDRAIYQHGLAVLWCSLVERSLKAGFNPDQPRVPAGNPDAGQWTSEGGTFGGNDTQVISDAMPDNEAISGAQYAARRISPAVKAQCEIQYKQDIFHCNMFGLRACYAQAALRYANCLRGLPIPPLNY